MSLVRDWYQTKNFTQQTIFDFEIFGLKYDLKNSESILTKNVFAQNFVALSFFRYFGQKTTESWEKVVHGKIFRFCDFRFEIRFETL